MDGGDVAGIVENSFTNTAASLDETVSWKFGFGGNLNAGLVQVGKIGDFVAAGARESFMAFSVLEADVLTEAMRMRPQDDGSSAGNVAVGIGAPVPAGSMPLAQRGTHLRLSTTGATQNGPHLTFNSPNISVDKTLGTIFFGVDTHTTILGGIQVQAQFGSSPNEGLKMLFHVSEQNVSGLKTVMTLNHNQCVVIGANNAGDSQYPLLVRGDNMSPAPDTRLYIQGTAAGALASLVLGTTPASLLGALQYKESTGFMSIRSNIDEHFVMDPSGRFGFGFESSTTQTIDAVMDVRGGAKYLGGIAISAQPIPTISSVTPLGTSGATTYGYKVTATGPFGETLGSAEVQTTTGNATLDGTNRNRVRFNKVEGAFTYKVYRVTSDGTPASTGLIGTLAFPNLNRVSAATLDFTDTGLAGGAAEPAVDSANGLLVEGKIGIGQAAGADIDEILHIQDSVDGGDVAALIENSFANTGSSVDETVSLKFGFGGVNTAALIEVGKIADFTSAGNEDAFWSLQVSDGGSLSEAIRAEGDTGVKLALYGGTAVIQATKINDPAGQANDLDSEARTAINAIIDAMEGLGVSAAV